jgi:hypothetical protein
VKKKTNEYKQEQNRTPRKKEKEIQKKGRMAGGRRRKVCSLSFM